MSKQWTNPWLNSVAYPHKDKETPTMKFRLDLVAIATRAVEVSQDELRAFMAKEYPGQTVPADDDEDAWGEVAYEFMHAGTLVSGNGWDSWLNDESEVTLI